MLKPLGVIFMSRLVVVLVILAVLTLIYCIRLRSRKALKWWALTTLTVLLLGAGATFVVAPKGARTVARLELPQGRAFVLRHTRDHWMEMPKVRFYARNPAGTWTSFQVISELVGASTTLTYDAASQEVVVFGAGSYSIPSNDYVQVDGSRLKNWQLPAGTQPGEEDPQLENPAAALDARNVPQE
jgi:hypothetical protein